MKELQFIDSRSVEWQAWDVWLVATHRSGRAKTSEGAQAGAAQAIPLPELPHRFRLLCQDLSLARDRNYSSSLQDELLTRVLAAHQRIYGARRREGNRVLAFILHGFPARVRTHWRLVAISALLFLVPLFGLIWALQHYPDAVYLLLSPDQVGSIEDMYAPTAKHLGRPRAASTDWMMWGFYIANNVRIDFQCFAGGIAFGLGALFYIVYNGLYIGAVAGHLTQLGYIETFWGFVAGHSAFELTGAVLSGAAGLHIGAALVAPGLRSRADALKHNAREAVQLLCGAALLTFLAAFIEAFWSPQRGMPVEIKYGVGILMWLLLAAYFGFAGRGRHAA